MFRALTFHSKPPSLIAFANASKSRLCVESTSYRLLQVVAWSRTARRCQSTYSRPRYHRFKSSEKERLYKRLGVIAATGAGIYYLTHLERVPISERRRFNDVSLQFEERMAEQAYQETMMQYGMNMLPSSHPTVQYVARVMKKIIAVSGMQNLRWELHVIRDPTPNAFVLPGGKVFVFEGILPICRDEDGLAAVLAHETAHQIARHSAEKIAFTRAVSCLFWLAAAAFDLSGQVSHLLLNFGLLLPFSRKMESEADYIGLMLMSQACYRPEAAKELWGRMHDMEEQMGRKVLAFASTHPASKKRQQRIDNWLPEARQRYETSDCYSETWPGMQAFREAFF
ncbi:metallopeptidase Oma1 [Schizosaccharomyces japonicus yFS275]|uniref:Metallopeptidase Oma1 n=1 Tax=Schizosaccharomyces japonicus (strain yFS275 / FY16936) TaxID=402676 RepID=B6K711_SCHJY|nr:metallopeptidase Oma1 [Schizosaccharomyces japonicus yFS275]EEB09315.1 metallopeptidase Oma1 [Schizosaccharomyces japonicus yFS275]